MGTKERRLGTKSEHFDQDLDVAQREASLLERVVVSVGLVIVVALVYQLVVGGIKIEVAGGRLTIDITGLVYWWQIFTGAVAPHN